MKNFPQEAVRYAMKPLLSARKQAFSESIQISTTKTRQEQYVLTFALPHFFAERSELVKLLLLQLLLVESS